MSDDIALASWDTLRLMVDQKIEEINKLKAQLKDCQSKSCPYKMQDDSWKPDEEHLGWID